LNGGTAHTICGLMRRRANAFAVEDPTQAKTWFRRAADQRDTDAQVNSATLQRTGKGAKQDFAEAARPLSPRCRQG